MPPVQELQNQTGALGGILGLVGGYLAGNPARKREQAQLEFEQKRETGADQRAAQELTNNTLEATDKHQAEVDKTTALAAKNLAHAQEAKVVGSEPSYDASNPNAWLSWAMKASHYYSTSDPEYSTKLAEQVRYGANPVAQEARATHDIAGAGLDKARTQQIVQWKVRADDAFQKKMQELQATTQGRLQVQQMQHAAAFARAALTHGGGGGGRGGGGVSATAQYGAAERETIAEMTALNVANGRNQTEAYQTAKTNYDAQLKAWQDQQTQGQQDVTAGRTPPQQFGQAPPQFTFDISNPQQAPSQAQIIMIPVPSPNGGLPRMVPHVINRPAPKPAGGGSGGSAKAISDAKAAVSQGADVNAVRQRLSSIVGAAAANAALPQAAAKPKPRPAVPAPSRDAQGVPLPF
jgi:hypothetical protein